jgi:hypothetical protein
MAHLPLKWVSSIVTTFKLRFPQVFNDGYVILVEKSVLCRTIFGVKKGVQGQRLFDSQKYDQAISFVLALFFK